MNATPVMIEPLTGREAWPRLFAGVRVCRFRDVDVGCHFACRRPSGPPVVSRLPGVFEHVALGGGERVESPLALRWGVVDVVRDVTLTAASVRSRTSSSDASTSGRSDSTSLTHAEAEACRFSPPTT